MSLSRRRRIPIGDAVLHVADAGADDVDGEDGDAGPRDELGVGLCGLWKREVVMRCDCGVGGRDERHW